MTEDISMPDIPVVTDLTDAKILGVDKGGKAANFPIANIVRPEKGIAVPATNPPGERFVGETWLVSTANLGSAFANFGNITPTAKVGAQYTTNNRFVWNAGAWTWQKELVDAPSLTDYYDKAAVDERTLAKKYVTAKIGVATPAAGDPAISSGTRIDNLYPSAQSGKIELTGHFKNAGTGKIKLFTKDGNGLFSLVTDIAITFVEGLNTFTIDIVAGEYIGFYSATTSISGITNGAGKSYRVAGEATGSGISASSSGYELQFNYRFVSTEPIKDATNSNIVRIESLEAKDLTIQDQITIPSPLFYGKLDLTASSGPTGSTLNARISTSPLGAGTDLFHPKNVWINVLAAGDFKVRFYEKSGSNYTQKAEASFTGTTLGIQAFSFDSDFQIQPNWHFGIRYTGTFRYASVAPAGNGPSVNVTTNVDNATVSGSSSAWDLYYKIEYGDKVPLKNVVLSMQSGEYVFVAKTGNDVTGDGTLGKPYLSISRAIRARIGKTYSKIVIGSGTYRETIQDGDLTFENIELVPAQKAVIKILGSDALSGFTKTSGRTNVYQAVFTGSIPSWTRAANPIFEDGKNSGLIDAADKHPLQKGLTHRLPFTPIMAQTFLTDLSTTLALIDANPGTYYYDSVNGIIYLHASGSDNPATNGYSYEVPVRDANVAPAITTLTNRPRITMDKIQFRYLKRGFSCNGYEIVKRSNCSILAVASDGITAGGWRDDTSFVQSFRDEAAYCDGDGFNGHYNIFSDQATQEMRVGHGFAEYTEPWAHDNFDDGMSHHERHTVCVKGGLFEWNGDNGFVPAQGCQAIIYDAVAQKNGQDPGGGATGTGFHASNDVSDGTNGTKLIAFNCIAVGNKMSFRSTSPTNVVVLYNCVGRTATMAEYYARDGAVLIANNCKVTNSDPAKIKQISAGGIITVVNDNSLT